MSFRKPVGRKARDLIQAIGKQWEEIADTLNEKHSDFGGSPAVYGKTCGGETTDKLVGIFLQNLEDWCIPEADFIAAIQECATNSADILAILRDEGTSLKETESDIVVPGKVSGKKLAKCSECGCKFRYFPSELEEVLLIDFGMGQGQYGKQITCKQPGCGNVIIID